GVGALGLICTLGVCLVLGGRLRGGWEFLSLVLPAGCVVALALGWRRRLQLVVGIPRYAIPVSGGMIVSAAVMGIGIVMARFYFLRAFLGLAILTGVVIALALYWVRSRQQNANGSLV